MVGVMGSLECMNIGVEWPPSFNHLECVLWLPMGPKDTGGCVPCSLESVRGSPTISLG